MKPLPRRIAYPIIAALSLALWAGILSPAFAQLPPSGQSVLNQGYQARRLTKSDTTAVPVTRGIFIGDGTACDVALLFNGDTSPVTFPNVQSGAIYPFSIIKLMSANTTCTVVNALY